MYSIQYEWKLDEDGNIWNIDLPSFEAWLRVNAGSLYSGNSADAKFTLWFTEEPSEDIKDLIDLQWASTAADEEIAKIKRTADKEKAVAEARLSVPSQNWDSLIAAERKIIMNQALTEADKTALLAKYPQE